MLKQIISESNIKQVRKLLEESERIVITCHKSPDGDAIGSALGLAHTLSNIGKEAKVVTPDRPPRNLRSLPGVKDVVPFTQYPDFAQQLLSDADLVFCLDFNALYRVDRMRDALAAAPCPKIMVDHHEGPEAFADVIISHPEQSSTSVLVFRLLCRLELFDRIDRKAASCIYTGMMTDTGNFTYNSNDPDLYIIIAELLRKGVNKDEIYKKVMNTKTSDVLKLHAYAIAEKMELFPELHTALIVLRQADLKQFDYHPGDDEGLVNMPLGIEDMVYSVYLREDSNQIKVSTRSIGDFRADLICQDFYNGGGHINAAGGELPPDLDKALETFRSTMPVIKKYLKNSNPQ
ncbi:MAG: bifunctional oligoribonuclease/PAP phosphatase NrnA [Muribaculum sp.]|nr:bifunctional oligoribonuclease/PAP phosphatase NrnA [Muribaculum sp.]